MSVKSLTRQVFERLLILRLSKTSVFLSTAFHKNPSDDFIDGQRVSSFWHAWQGSFRELMYNRGTGVGIVLYNWNELWWPSQSALNSEVKELVWDDGCANVLFIPQYTVSCSELYFNIFVTCGAKDTGQ